MDIEDEYVEYIEPEGPAEFVFLEKLILYRLDKYFPESHGNNQPPAFPHPDTWDLPLGRYLVSEGLGQAEAIILLMALAPHVAPELFNRAIERKLPDPAKTSVDFPQIGGVRGKNSRFFLPTAQTAIFLIADDDLQERLKCQQIFGAGHLFSEKKILWLEEMVNGEPAMHGRMILSPDYIERFTYGVHKTPQFSMSFPAKKIAPSKTDADKPSFDNLVIPFELMEQINELKSWLRHNDTLMNKYGMSGKLRKGYRALFYGPPGTGKTFTAQILGNDLDKEVFKVDLSMVVSKYIGETEKNLEMLFARAEDKGWILFFDEADALFGKRTNVRDAHDKYANQEVSYLLQRIEDYNGLVILATNMKNNIDDAFIRRFNSILKFPFPDPGQRSQIWNKLMPAAAKRCRKNASGEMEEIDIGEAVKKYELAGGSIVNVVHYAGIKAVEAHDGKEGPLVFQLSNVQEGIRRELTKEGKPFAL
ncbi:MAG: ATP-binding protein [Gemmatimonadaceae bacterium]|nr:ATP-binding protein [Chitinophagaceae bacterium]